MSDKIPPRLPVPRVGVAAIILRNGRVLVGLRNGTHDTGTWGLPGGYLEFGETPETCVAREVLEETGLRVTATQRASYTNNLFVEEGKHTITLFLVVQVAAGEPRCCEPEKCAAWEWHSWNKLPSPLFLPLQQLVDSGFVLGNASLRQ